MEVTQGKEALLTRVHLIKGNRDWQLFLNHSLDVLEHL